MVSCSVYGCPNSSLISDPSVQYYYFPKHPIIIQQWIQASGWPSDQLDVDAGRICSVHFDRDSYEIGMKNYVAGYSKILKFDAVPTLFLPEITQNVKESELLSHETVRDVVIYTIQTDTEGTSNIVPLEESAIQKHFIDLQPSTSTVFEIEAHQEPLKKETVEIDADNYKHIRGPKDLYWLQIENQRLKTEIKNLELSTSTMNACLEKTVKEFLEVDNACKEIQTQLTKAKRVFLTFQEQKNLLSKVFSESQIKILCGKKKIYWSNDDMAVGYTIRHLSNKRCYSYLTKSLHIPLPAVSSIKRWVTTKKTHIKKEEEGAKQLKLEFIDCE